MYKDSAKFWFPRLQSVEAKLFPEVKLPHTIFVDYDEAELFSRYGNHVAASAAYDRLLNSCIPEFRYRIPSDWAFLRTDVTSAKHLGLNAFRVYDEATLDFALRTTIRHAEVKTALSKYKSSAIMLREWIDMPKNAPTAFNGLTIGKEWRVFASHKGLNCINGYWPHRALEGHLDSNQFTPDLNPVPPAAIRLATAYAVTAMPDQMWSIDFVEDMNGQLWLIDMARGENSYHHDNCRCGIDRDF